MTRRRGVIVAAAGSAAGVVGLIGLGLWGGEPSPPVAGGASETAGTTHEVSAPPVGAEAPPPVSPPAARPEAPPENLAALEARIAEEESAAEAERLRRRVREVVRQEEALARWDEGVSRESLAPRHIEPAVRRFFGALELEPVLREGGRMEGLEVRRVAEEGAAARAGLATGDVIVSLLGEELDDPAQLPGLLARLPRRLPFCVERGGATRCMELELD